MNNRKINISGILLLDKPLDVSSNAALQRAKRLFTAKKAGHTGNLDPKATGMLPICFGEATKFSQFLLDADKYYQVEVKLGVKTTTGDAEGEIIETKPVPDFSPDDIKEALKNFKGEQQQVPPMFSAIKQNGQPLYILARKGIEVHREPRTIYIRALELIALDKDTFKLDVHCSKGTYIRTLVEEIGDALGVGAYVSALRRVGVMPYEIGKMYTFESLEEIHSREGLPGLTRCLLPLESSVQGLPVIKLSSAAAFYLRMGQSVTVPFQSAKGHVRVYSNNTEFLGVGNILDDGRLSPQRLITQL